MDLQGKCVLLGVTGGIAAYKMANVASALKKLGDNIRKLISVEAKMTDIKKVAEQSLINTWFASQSYALTNTSNPQSSTIKKFERQGTGLYCKKRSFRKIVEAKKLASPSSYQSLQFNEWIGRTVAHLS